MKSITIPAIAMAQKVSGTTYDTTSERYNIYPSHAWAYIQFAEIPAALSALVPNQVDIYVYMDGLDVNQDVRCWVCDVDVKKNKYGMLTGDNKYLYPDARPGWAHNYDVVSYYRPTLNMIVRGMAVVSYDNRYFGPDYVYSVNSEFAPYGVLYYDEGSPITLTDEPGGYVDRTAANTFRWHTTWVGFPVENLTQTSATLQWKDGSSGTVNSISISGASTSYTMAANTLPESDAIYWRVQTVTADGTATSEWKTLRTTDTPAVATPISPDSAYIDGTKTSRFVWIYQTDSGAAQQGYDLQVKGPLDADYTTIKSETTAATYADVPAGTLPGGSVQWRVRAYNQSSVAGEWSAPLTCVVISAPNAPEVWVDSATPRPTVSWSAVGQLGYQVRVSGQYDSGTRFGTEKTFKIPEYLAYNEVDIFAAESPLTKTSSSYNGVTYTWSGDTCTLTGGTTASQDSVKVLQTIRSALPASVVPGRIYYLRFSSSNDQLTGSYPFSVRVIFYDANNAQVGAQMFFPKPRAFTVPDGAAKWYVVLYVARGVTLTGDPWISDIRLLGSESGQGQNTPIEVRVLGEYDLWSPWGRANAQIDTAGTLQMLLTGEAADGDASLSWGAVTGAEKYEILRLGVKIAETTDTAYTDRYAIGSVTYRVRACFAGDEYTISGSVTIALSVTSPRLTALDGDWIRLDKYTNPLPAAQITASREVALTQYAGIAYPVAEVGPHRTRLYVCNPAFSDHAQAAAFEQLLGRPVFVKDQYGNSLYGVMTSVQRSSQRFYTELTAMIQEIGGLDL